MATKQTTTELLFTTAHRMGLSPEWVVKNGLFAVTIDSAEHYINFERSPLNSHLSISLSGNKYLTRLILKRHGYSNIPFMRARTLLRAQNFLSTHKTIVAKPLRGSGSRDIHIITKESELSQLAIADYILEKYSPGKEMRYLVMNSKVVAVHESRYGVSVQEDRHLERLSLPETNWNSAIVEQSVKIAGLLGLEFAVVDYLVDSTGVHNILEVGAAPGFKWFHAPTSGPAVDVARMFLDAYIQKSAMVATRSLL